MLVCYSSSVIRVETVHPKFEVVAKEQPTQAWMDEPGNLLLKFWVNLTLWLLESLIPIGNECVSKAGEGGGGRGGGLFYLVPGMPKGLALQECLFFFVFLKYAFNIYNNLGLKRNC